MITKKQVNLAAALAVKTSTGKVPWEVTPDDKTFRADFSSNSVEITELTNRMGDSPDYIISIINDEGVVVDRYSDGDLYGFDEDEGWFRRLETMFDEARRKASGSDRVVDDILRILSEDDND